MVKFMDWTKILNKEWISVAQIIATVVIIVLLVITLFSGNRAIDSAREDIRSAREQLVRIEEFNNQSIELITGIIDSTDKVISGLEKLESENITASDIARQLESDNIELTRGIRELQDRTLESELVTDRIKQIQRDIEQENGID